MKITLLKFDFIIIIKHSGTLQLQREHSDRFSVITSSNTCPELQPSTTATTSFGKRQGLNSRMAEKSFQLQQQIRSNAQELGDFLNELNKWESDIKRKDEELKRSAEIEKVIQSSINCNCNFSCCQLA